MKSLDIAIVTSCHNYGRYLADWARSIVGLEGYYPAVCAIVDNGSTDATPHAVVQACQVLTAAGIRCVKERTQFTDLGTARNRAVALSGATEWVMHLDADDMLMPHCLKDVAALMPKADVIGAGYRRSGDLKSGPSNRTRVYSTHRGQATLRSKAPCSGVSPFRRSLWQVSPYRTDMRGGWDTALWIGFAQHDARFVPTRRPVFLYRQHADSVFNMRRISLHRGKLVGVKLGQLRAGISKGVSVVIPFRPDGAERDLACEWVVRRYAALHPDWEVVLGQDSSNGAWCKGAAINAGLQRATGATLVIADADVFTKPAALVEAVRLVEHREAQWVVPHRLVKRLNNHASRATVWSDPGRAEVAPQEAFARRPYQGYAGGGVVVVTRSDYVAVGGVPRQFVGWGAEDECLAVILDTILGPHTRLDADLWHLWHSPVRRMHRTQYTENRVLLQHMMQFVGNPEAMWGALEQMALGLDPRAMRPHGGGRAGTVMMVAVHNFQRGQTTLEVGQTFKATEEEARRHEARTPRMAVRLNSNNLEVVRRRSRERTLDIRAEQAERNDAARKDFEERQKKLLALRR
jgi:GT2 family glycosyltransferase